VGNDWGLRVLVTLKSDVLVDEAIGDGSQHNPYRILGDSQNADPSVWDGPIATGFASGTGTEDDPYLISSEAELAYLAQSVNNGNSYEGQYIKLDERDLQFMEYTNWVPIGTKDNPFSGNFSGGGHVISNLHINNKTADNQGLFGVVDGGRITSLTLEDPQVSGNRNVGGICGAAYNNAIIEDCGIRTGIVEGIEKVGSIVRKFM